MIKTSTACGSEEGNTLPDNSEATPIVIGCATVPQVVLRTIECTDQRVIRMLGLRA